MVVQTYFTGRIILPVSIFYEIFMDLLFKSLFISGEKSSSMAQIH